MEAVIMEKKKNSEMDVSGSFTAVLFPGTIWLTISTLFDLKKNNNQVKQQSSEDSGESLGLQGDQTCQS